MIGGFKFVSRGATPPALPHVGSFQRATHHRQSRAAPALPPPITPTAAFAGLGGPCAAMEAVHYNPQPVLAAIYTHLQRHQRYGEVSAPPYPLAWPLRAAARRRWLGPRPR